jgi:hypothetical protein
MFFVRATIDINLVKTSCMFAFYYFLGKIAFDIVKPGNLSVVFLMSYFKY